MSWRDAQGLEEWHGCCGRKLFYCSKLALLNDDDNDEEETFGEYVQSSKQLKKLRSWVEMPKRKDSMDTTTETFSPWFWWIFPWLISVWLHRRSSMTHSSNSGAWLNSFVIPFPHLSYQSHDESKDFSYCHPILLLFLCCVNVFPMAALLCLQRLRVMTHTWLIFWHIILHAGRIFRQRHRNRIVCLVVESALHVYKGQFSP